VGSFFQNAGRRLHWVSSGCTGLHGVAWGCIWADRGAGAFSFFDSGNFGKFREVRHAEIAASAEKAHLVSSFALSAIFAFFASHFRVARKARSLSLPPRCAFVVTNAQRAVAKHQ
jgi:hypothetical protein